MSSLRPSSRCFIQGNAVPISEATSLALYRELMCIRLVCQVEEHKAFVTVKSQEWGRERQKRCCFGRKNKENNRKRNRERRYHDSYNHTHISKYKMVPPPCLCIEETEQKGETLSLRHIKLGFGLLKLERKCIFNFRNGWLDCLTYLSNSIIIFY